MKTYWLMLFLLIMNTSCAQQESKVISHVSDIEMKEVVLIDVRTPKEYKAGHLANAVNIDWLGADFDKHVKNIAKNKTIYVYCKAGGRSANAQKRLKEMGYTHVVNLEGGYDAWLAAKK